MCKASLPPESLGEDRACWFSFESVTLIETVEIKKKKNTKIYECFRAPKKDFPPGWQQLSEVTEKFAGVVVARPHSVQLGPYRETHSFH